MTGSGLMRPMVALLQRLQTDKAPPAPIVLDPLFATQLKTIAQDVRDFITPDWRSLTPGKVSAGMCMKSAKFLRNVLEQQSIPCKAHLGHFLHDGAWITHAWVKAGNAIVDITSEQFDQSALIVTAADDKRYRTEFKHYLLEWDADRQVQTWMKDWQKRRLVEIVPGRKDSMANNLLLSASS